jgi:hypothetical protein
MKTKALSVFILGIILIFVAILSYHAVDNSLSAEDREYIPKYLIGINPLSEKRTYKEELDFIIKVQRSVLDVAPQPYKGLPLNSKREPRELFEAKTGLCFDRSRVIEKILIFSNFETRHVSIYSTKETGSSLKSLIKPGNRSHAVTEVLTKRGWLVVDSNAAWVSLNAKREPLSIEKIKSSTEGSFVIQWEVVPPDSIYEAPFTYVYGLYSRHGRFYPPYNFIPDVNYSEFIQNFL